MKRVLVALVLAVICVALLALPAAAWGFALSGSSLEFRLSPGQTSEGTVAYLVPINSNDVTVWVVMEAEQVPGITVQFSEDGFYLPAAESKRVDLIVSVADNVVPGTYSILLTATIGAPPPPGDANDDGQVNIVDAMLIAQYTCGLPVRDFNIAQAAAPAAPYDEVNIVDAMFIAQYTVGLRELSVGVGIGVGCGMRAHVIVQ